MKKKTTIDTVSLTLVLAVYWLLLSGYLKPLLLSFGAISVALVMILIRRMDSRDNESQKPALNSSFFRYVIWLLGQIILSSIEVTKIVWGKKKALSPVVGKLSVSKVPKRSRVLYANSITLTPGTLSIDIDDKYITVHALNKKSIEALRHGEMAEKVYSEAKGDS